MVKSTLGAALAAVLLLSGCGESSGELSAADQAQSSSLEAAKADADKAKAEAEEAKAEAETAEAEAETAKAEAEQAKAEAAKTEADASAAVAPNAQTPVAPAAPSVGSVPVPDVAGQDHQLAQDTMQAAGLYNLTEEDATGAGRVMLVDRNWVVVEQLPPAGTLVASDATITLRSKKKGE